MTRRTIRIAVELVEESDDDGPPAIDTTGEPLDELSAIKPTLAKCGQLLQDDARRRRAVGK